MSAWLLSFSGLPLSPNDRPSVFKKAANNRQWRQKAAVVARNMGIPRLERAKVSIVIYRRAVGRADEDNDRARFKPVIDGLRDAGVLTGDTRGQIIYGRCIEKKAIGQKGFDLMVEAKPKECSRCKSQEDDVAEFLDWWFCLKCYSDMTCAFLTQRDYDSVQNWLRRGSQGNEQSISQEKETVCRLSA